MVYLAIGQVGDLTGAAGLRRAIAGAPIVIWRFGAKKIRIKQEKHFEAWGCQPAHAPVLSAGAARAIGFVGDSSKTRQMNVSPLNAPKRKTGELPPVEPIEQDVQASRPPPVEPPPTRPSELAAYGLLLGVAMIALAAIWRLALGDESLSTWFPADRWAFNLMIGALAGLVFSIAAWAVFRKVPSFRHIKTLILRTIDMQTLSTRHAVMFGLIAGIPEEILFRGAVQPAIGWLLTALLFGVLHGVTPAYFVYATLASVLLGGLADWSGGLWAPIAAHTTIDISMFLLLMRTWRRRQRRAQRQRERMENTLAG